MKKLMAMLIVAFTIGSVAYAEMGISVEQTAGSDLISVSVDIDKQEKSVPITIKIIDNMANVNYITMGYTDEQGIFKFSYYNDTQTGDFKIIAKSPTVAIEGGYLKIGENEFNEIITAINTQLNLDKPDGGTVKKLFELYERGITLDRTVFKTLENKDLVYQIIVLDKGNKGQIKTMQDVVRAFYQAVAVEKINEQTEAILILAQDSVYMEYFGGKEGLLFKELEKATDEVKSFAYSKLSKTNISLSAITERMELGLMEGKILKSAHWNDVKETLTAYKSKLNISLDNVKENVYKDMMEKDYPSYQNCIDDFERLKKYYNEQEKPSSSEKHGSGSPGVVAAPSVKTEQPVKLENEPQQGKLIFEDMDEAKWAIEAVSYVYEKGIVSGVGENCFQPNRNITRAEATKMIVSMLDEKTSNIKLPFLDVSINYWCYPYICSAYRLGIVNGKSDTEFDTNAIITRQEMAVMAWKAMKLMKIDIQTAQNVTFADSEQIAPWSIEAVSTLFQMQIIVGRKGETGNIFSPTDGITRAEASTIIYQILKKSA